MLLASPLPLGFGFRFLGLLTIPSPVPFTPAKVAWKRVYHPVANSYGHIVEIVVPFGFHVFHCPEVFMFCSVIRSDTEGPPTFGEHTVYPFFRSPDPTVSVNVPTGIIKLSEVHKYAGVL